MKILHAYRINTAVPLAEYKQAAVTAAETSAADLLLFEYLTEEQQQIFELEEEDEEDTAVGYIAERVMGRDFYVPEGVVSRDELLRVCGLMSETFPPGGTVLQLGMWEGIFAAVGSGIGTVYVLGSPDDVNEDIFARNCAETAERVRWIQEKPGNVLSQTTESFQPDSVLVIDDQDAQAWYHLIRHLKPGVPTPIVCMESSTLIPYLNESGIHFEKTESSQGWLVVLVTPAYVGSESQTDE